MLNNTPTQPNMQALSPQENEMMLAWNTNLMEQMMPQEALEMEENGQEQAEEQPTEQHVEQPTLREQYEDKEPVENEDLEEIKDEIKSLREEIKKAINEDDEQEEITTTPTEAE